MFVLDGSGHFSEQRIGPAAIGADFLDDLVRVRGLGAGQILHEGAGPEANPELHAPQPIKLRTRSKTPARSP